MCPQPAIMKAPEAFARMTDDQAAEAEAYTLGVQAVIWSMQWIKAAEAFRMFTAPLPEGQEHSPFDFLPHGINVWGHAQALLTSKFRTIETPNTETLYSIVLLDLSDGPIVVVHPDLGERYFRSTVWQLHGDTDTISQKKDGGHPPPYVIVPMGWKGNLPQSLNVIESRSRYIQVTPHIAVYGEADLPNVHALQKGLKIIALKDWGKSNTEVVPGAPMRPLRRPGTKTPDDLMYFEELGETLKDLTVRDDELGFARQLERIGITLKDGFQFDQLDASTVAGLRRALPDAQTIIAHKARSLAGTQSGGTWTIGFGLTGLDDWFLRAAVGFGYVWADLENELLFPFARVDEQGQPFNGANKYVLHFPKGQLPPARYWRISMYDIEGFFFDNPINRYGIGNMAETLAPDADGGLTIYIQHDSPGNDKENNWLPAHKDGFFMVMRMYQPEERMYRGEYIIPPVKKV